MSKNILEKIFCVVLIIGFLNCNVNACSCTTISFEKAIEYADEIFVGKIVKAEKFNNGTIHSGNQIGEIKWDWKYYFEVSKKWKGNSQSELIIYQGGSSCDLSFEIYHEYLVYAAESKKENPFGITLSPNKLSTYLCSRTIHNPKWRNSEMENWFEEDISKLAEDLPLVKLKKSSLKKWILFCGFFVIIIGFYSFRKMKTNR